jgi:hypothetical protein
MLWTTASCLLILPFAAVALYFLGRQLHAAFALKRELETALEQLQAALPAAHEATARLEAAIRRAESLRTAPPRDTLASIEQLAEPRALADRSALDKLAANLSSRTSDTENFFEQDEKALSVARLCDQGLKPADISRRLSLPVGEVEFLLSLRPASQA